MILNFASTSDEGRKWVTDVALNDLRSDAMDLNSYLEARRHKFYLFKKHDSYMLLYKLQNGITVVNVIITVETPSV